VPDDSREDTAQDGRTPPELHFRTFVAGVVGRLAVPFGFTLSIWSANALAVYHLGSPSIWDVFLFVGGASLGYLFAAYVVASRRRRPAEEVGQHVHLALVDVIALFLTLPAALVARIPATAPAGFFLTGLAVATTYILVLGALEYLASRLGLGVRR